MTQWEKQAEWHSEKNKQNETVHSQQYKQNDTVSQTSSMAQWEEQAEY